MDLDLLPLYEQALTDCRQVLGDDTHTLTSVNNLAAAFQATGDLGRAIPLYEQALPDCRLALGDDQPPQGGHPERLAELCRARRQGSFAKGD